MEQEQTKTVRGFFKDVQVTKAEFVQRWVNHMNELLKLADTPAEVDQIEAMIVTVRTIAERSWDKMK